MPVTHRTVHSDVVSFISHISKADAAEIIILFPAGQDDVRAIPWIIFQNGNTTYDSSLHFRFEARSSYRMNSTAITADTPVEYNAKAITVVVTPFNRDHPRSIMTIRQF